jgi:tetratricopeptide (TPR) repeat protein
LALARLHLALNDVDKIPAILSRFVDPSRPPNYEIYFLAGQAHQIRGEFALALDLFDRALAHFGVNTNLLNAVGECRLRLGRPEEALAAWEKSLRIDPGQPDIRKKADALKEKK